jgi:hypothetical protein
VKICTFWRTVDSLIFWYVIFLFFIFYVAVSVVACKLLVASIKYIVFSTLPFFVYYSSTKLT